MLRMFTGPLIMGISVFLLIYFVFPLVIPKSAIVSGVGEYANNLSNSYFASMPSIIAGYIANLNLAVVAVTAGLLSMVVIQLLLATAIAFSGVTKSIIFLLRHFRKKEQTPDLPPIEFDSKFKGQEKDKILGRGLDSIDQT